MNMNEGFQMRKREREKGEVENILPTYGLRVVEVGYWKLRKDYQEYGRGTRARGFDGDRSNRIAKSDFSLMDLSREGAMILMASRHSFLRSYQTSMELDLDR